MYNQSIGTTTTPPAQAGTLLAVPHHAATPNPLLVLLVMVDFVVPAASSISIIHGHNTPESCFGNDWSSARSDQKNTYNKVYKLVSY